MLTVTQLTYISTLKQQQETAAGIIARLSRITGIQH